MGYIVNGIGIPKIHRLIFTDPCEVHFWGFFNGGVRV